MDTVMPGNTSADVREDWVHVHDDHAPRTASVIIPAHNEEQSIARLLEELTRPQDRVLLEVVVVCNGCTDGTADVCRRFGSKVHVIEMPTPSKRLALRRGDDEAQHFPRAYVDGDVVISVQDIVRIIEALGGGVEAAAPSRVFSDEGVSRWVRWYYDVWQRLPHVMDGLFGRGVIVLSERGHQRIQTLPMVMSDDLALSEAFAPAQRLVVKDARVVIRPPRTLSQLVRRRKRVVTGNAQLDQMDGRSPTSRTSVGVLGRMAVHHPSVLLKLPVFAAVTVAATLGAQQQVRAGDFNTWLRDDSRS